MAQIISLVNQKGGVGKTTTAINLAQYLAESGRLVLLVDLDPQANATSGMGVDPKTVQGSIYDLMIRQAPLEQIIKQTGTTGYDLIPSAPDLSGAAVELAAAREREYWLKRVLDKAKEHYDYIIIDSPPSLDLLTINGLVAADGIIIPVQCEYYALEGLSRLLETISLIRRGLNPNLEIVGALLTMYDKRNRLARQVVREVQDNFPGRVFTSVIPRNVKLSEAPSFGKSILDFANLSKGAKSYSNLAKELIQLERQRFNI